MSAFRVSATGGNGLSYSRTRGPGFAAPTVGVRTSADPTWIETARAVALVLPEGAAFSHETALRILGIPFHEDDPQFHVTVPAGHVRGRRGCVTWHRSELGENRRTVRGFTVTTPWKTWCDLGATLELPELVAVTDALLRRGYLVREELIVPAGCRGARNLRWAAQLADSRSLSFRESELRVHFWRTGFPEADLNPDIIVDGIWVARGDFVWWAYTTVVEYDGEHHASLAQRHQDVVTRDSLRSLGWHVKVVTAKHFKQLKLTLNDIAGILRSRGWTP